MLVVARLSNVLCAYSTLLVLTRLLTVEDFGLFVVVNAIASVLNTVVGTGFNQATSRAVAARLLSAASVRKTSLSHAAWAAGALSLLLAAASPLLAWALDDDRTSALLLIVALSPGLYALFGVHAGVLNGTANFGRQGALATFLSVARLVLMALAAAIGIGVSGVIAGSVVAAAATFALSFVLVRRVLSSKNAPLPPQEKSSLAFGPTLRHVIAFSGAAFFLQMLMTADLLLLKRFAAEANDAATAHYAAAQSIARLVFFLFLAVSQMAFPRIAKGLAKGGAASSEGGLSETTLPGSENSQEREKAQRAATLVFSLLVIALAGVVALSTPLREAILGFLFPAAYRAGAPALLWLLGAAALLSLTEATLAMVSAATGAKRAALVLGCAWVLQVGAALWWIPIAQGEGAARATFVASAFALVGAIAFARRHLRLSLKVGPVALGAGLAIGAVFVAQAVAQAPAASTLAVFQRGAGLCVFLVGAYGLYAVLPLTWLWRQVKAERKEQA